METVSFSFGDTHVPLKYKLNARAKRLSLRFSLQEAALVLTLPPRTRPSKIQDFLKQSQPWIEKQWAKVAPSSPILPGKKLFLHGTPFECVTDPLRRKPALCHTTHTLRLPKIYKQKALHDLFKNMAKDFLIPYVKSAANTLGQSAEKITLKDTKSRWGSCSSRKTISLSWRLILAPPEVAQYVCVHEAAHLIHMNHSKAFWKTVEDLCPAYRSHKKWLKENGPHLMQLGREG